MADTTTRPVIARFIPFEAMSPRQQAEHLVHAHGFDDTYFWRSDSALIELDTKTAAVDAWTDNRFQRLDTRDESFPCAAGRDGWHEGDHADDDFGLGLVKHTHTKR